MKKTIKIILSDSQVSWKDHWLLKFMNLYMLLKLKSFRHLEFF